MLAERLGRLAGHLAAGRIESIGIRTYGEVAEAQHSIIGTSAVAGLLSAILSGGVSPVNARQLAANRRIEIAETASQRPRRFVGVISVQVHTADAAGRRATRWVEGVVAHGREARLVLVDGIDVDAPLEGAVLVVCNDDRPGVVGGVGTVLGAEGVNIASLSLGRRDGQAIAVAALDIETGISDDGRPRFDWDRVERALRAVPAVKDVWLAALGRTAV